MLRRRIVVGLLALTVTLAAAAPAVAGGRSDAFAGRPAGVFLSRLWTQVFELLEDLLAPAAPRGPKASVAADDGGAPPPQPASRGGMDPNG